MPGQHKHPPMSLRLGALSAWVAAEAERTGKTPHRVVVEAVERAASEVIGYRAGDRVYAPADVEVMIRRPLSGEPDPYGPEEADRLVKLLREDLGAPPLTDQIAELSPQDARTALARLAARHPASVREVIERVFPPDVEVMIRQPPAD
jgi:hypothetical protein